MLFWNSLLKKAHRADDHPFARGLINALLLSLVLIMLVLWWVL
jgi:hypothetical protein